MRPISDTIAHLAAGETPHGDGSPTVLRALDGFGTNPGALKAFVHVPDALGSQAALVVVLHGCGQSAERYDRASGWSRLADEQGFALLYPEQRRANNVNGCFNWFKPDDTRRDAGEAMSIRQMISAMQERYAIDSHRIFITGLSAGGAMAGTMLATYPDVFAGGAIIAGLAYGVASGMIQAFDRMRGHGLPGDEALQAALRNASDHVGSWPRVSIWHGGKDETVSVRNADAILAQWRGVHGLADRPPIVDRVDHVPHRSWHGADGRVLIEDYRIPNMAHGIPLKADGAGAYGSPAPYMLDVGISSTLRIAQFWEIVTEEPRAAACRRAFVEPTVLPDRPQSWRLQGRRIAAETAHAPFSVGKAIEDALRAAGLMK